MRGVNRIPKPKTLEQCRRDLKASDPELYEYIKNTEQAKVLDSAGDRLSSMHEATNYLWSRSGELDNKAKSVALNMREQT